MAINISRFYQRECLKLECEIVTPMFLGNAQQEAELRSAPFKGLLRYWWRVARGQRYEEYGDMLAEENRIFGSADEGSGKSRVSVSVTPITKMAPSKEGFGHIDNVAHPECERTNGRTNPLNYLAGIGLIRNGIQHSYFPVRERFRLSITAANDVVEEVNSAISIFARFAAIGSRCRNGWGCLVMSGVPHVSAALVDWNDAMGRDYPHCLGRDERGALVWKTRQQHQDWKQCMRDLAENYIKIRTSLNVVAGNPPDRHLLGYPVTNHAVQRTNWGNQGRHSSALRLLVKKERNGALRGYFLHLPHAFSKTMWPNDIQRQIRIWRQVHDRLDELCERVPSGEVE